MTVGRRITGFLALSRPLNVLSAGFLTFLGAFIAGGAAEAPAPTGVAVLATVLAVAAGNAVNDYFDRDIDAVNRPDRPIPSGRVSPRGALTFSAAAFGIAVLLAVTLPAPAIAIAVFNLAALLLYTEYFKGTPGLGNAVVAYLVGSTFVFGAAAVDAIGVAPVVLGVLAGVATFSREIIKDVEDLAGDREEGLRTLPIALGERRALWIATLAIAVAVLASPLPYLLDVLGVVYMGVVLPADALMVYAMARAFGDPEAGQAAMKVGMLLAALAFIAGRASVLVGWPG
jgi:geranylgeranylglycerol-phosphate geranylgeranyltransferase